MYGGGQQVYLNEDHPQVPLMRLQQQQLNPAQMLPSSPPSPPPPEESDANNEDREASVLRIVISYVLFLAFISLVSYSLYVSDVPKVTNNCGYSLWNFVFARLCISAFEATLVICFGYYSVIVSDRPTPVEGTAYSTCLAVVMHATLVGVGASYVSEAMNIEECRAVLSSVSVTKSPLLGIIGYIYMAMDSVVVIALSCMLCFAMYSCGILWN